MKRVTDIDVQTAIANAIGAVEIELFKVFNDGMDSEITLNFSFQLATAIQSLLMGRPVIIDRHHPCATLPRLVEDAPLGVIHPDSELLEPMASPAGNDRPPPRLLH